MTSTVRGPGAAIEQTPVGRFVRISDLPGGRGAAQSALSRAVRGGDLVVIRRGLYYKGAKTRYGMTRPSTAEVAVIVLGVDGVGPSGWTAARTFELTTQVPAELMLAVTGRARPRIHGVRIVHRGNESRRLLRYAEIGVLELLRGEWRSTVDHGWPALVRAIDRHVRAGRIRLDMLVRVGAAERSVTLRQDMARLLADLGVDADDLTTARPASPALLPDELIGDPLGFIASLTFRNEPLSPQELPPPMTAENAAWLLWDGAAPHLSESS